jgi:hypothetical protein
LPINRGTVTENPAPPALRPASFGTFVAGNGNPPPPLSRLVADFSLFTKRHLPKKVALCGKRKRWFIFYLFIPIV